MSQSLGQKQRIKSSNNEVCVSVCTLNSSVCLISPPVVVKFSAHNVFCDLKNKICRNKIATDVSYKNVLIKMRNGCRYKVSTVSLVSKARKIAQSRYPELELNPVEGTVNWKATRTIQLNRGSLSWGTNTALQRGWMDGWENPCLLLLRKVQIGKAAVNSSLVTIFSIKCFCQLCHGMSRQGRVCICY